MPNRIAQLQQELQYWNESVDFNPQMPNPLVRRGMAHFKLGQIEAAIQDFDQAEHLDRRLTPYLWQRGLAYYYAQRFEDGVRQFEVDLTVNGQDVEETVWRYLCMAQSRGVMVAREALLPAGADPRSFMPPIYALYAGKCSAEDLIAGAAKDDKRGKFYRYLYAGLYAEVHQDPVMAQQYFAIAADRYPLDDYMWHLAVVHRQLRGWG